VLDVATFNGFWAFELERRGADVVALDLPSTLDIDLPPCARARAVTEDIGMPLSVGFEIAAEALGSTVSLRHGSVYSLDPESWGTFDFVHIGDLLLHLEQPLEALRRVRTVTDGVLHLSDAYDPTLPRGGVRYLGGWRGAQWWIPSIDTLCQWVIDAGFADAVVLDTYRLNPTSEPGGIWRAIIRATT
jgi:tRNA (mo5U34)-methyltransferase